VLALTIEHLGTARLFDDAIAIGILPKPLAAGWHVGQLFDSVVAFAVFVSLGLVVGPKVLEGEKVVIVIHVAIAKVSRYLKSGLISRITARYCLRGAGEDEGEGLAVAGGSTQRVVGA
jgi:hypothetical protein